jgi:phosphate transport system protein
MARDSLDRKIKELKDELLIQGSMVEQMTLHAIQALVKRDLMEAERIYDYDHRVNQKHLAIEKQCLTLLAIEPPILATDLRLLASILEVNTALERFGDFAKGIAWTCLLIGIESPISDSSQIKYIAEQVINMLHQALGAFVQENISLADEIPCQQENIKNLVEEANQDLFSRMIGNPNNIQQINKLLYVTHNLERMAELVKNICKRISYISTGHLNTIQKGVDG